MLNVNVFMDEAEDQGKVKVSSGRIRQPLAIPASSEFRLLPSVNSLSPFYLRLRHKAVDK